MNIVEMLKQAFIQWGVQLHDTFIEESRYMMLVDGLKNTMIRFNRGHALFAGNDFSCSGSPDCHVQTTHFLLQCLQY